MAISSAHAVGCSNGGTIGITPEQSASCIIAKAATGSHTLTLDGYSRIKSVSARSWGNWITSATFTVGGHIWSAEFLYKGLSGWIHMMLRLHCKAAGEEILAAYVFSILDQDGRLPCYRVGSSEVDTFNAAKSSGARRVISCTFDEARAMTYLSGDCLTMRCDVTVYKEVCTEDRVVPARLVAVPPSDMGEQLGRLLATGVGADLRFQVGRETFAVHRHILKVRSPVLLEEILGAATTCENRIGGVEAKVFKALLHYIYTDSLPGIDEGEMTDMVRCLIVAADRYRLQRLKLICEDMLCHRVHTSMVAATLALAEEYRCCRLRKACVQFLMSGSNLKAAMAAGGFEHMRSSCPSVLKELTCSTLNQIKF